MYSSKLSLSTSFQVAQKASTMVKVVGEAEHSEAGRGSPEVIMPPLISMRRGGAWPSRPVGSGGLLPWLPIGVFKVGHGVRREEKKRKEERGEEKKLNYSIYMQNDVIILIRGGGVGGEGG